MLLEHRGARPSVPESAYVAPSAVLCGAVTLGEWARVLHGAVLTAENGEVRLGADFQIFEISHPRRIAAATAWRECKGRATERPWGQRRQARKDGIRG